MHTTPRNRALVWILIAVAVVINIAGYLLDLYDRFRWFDEVIHTYTSFALTLPLGLLLYGVVLDDARAHPFLLILTVASLGLAVGALWEIAEWAYDQLVPENAILGKTDTIIDLILDAVGALAAGVVCLGMVRQP